MRIGRFGADVAGHVWLGVRGSYSTDAVAQAADAQMVWLVLLVWRNRCTRYFRTREYSTVVLRTVRYVPRGYFST